MLRFFDAEMVNAHSFCLGGLEVNNLELGAGPLRKFINERSLIVPA
jgi:hypothetical protein